MSIQSNINSAIGQTAALAALTPAVQDLRENVKLKQEYKQGEQELTRLESQMKDLPIGDDKTRKGFDVKSDDNPNVGMAEANYYNDLMETQLRREQALRAKGKLSGQFKAREEAIWPAKAEELRKKAEAQRKKVDDEKAALIAEKEAQKEALRKMILNPEEIDGTNYNGRK